MASSDEISQKAIDLASEGDRADAITALRAYAGDGSAGLEQARVILVKRIRTRTDDFPATAGLTLVNRALSQVGWVGTSNWEPREWRLPRWRKGATKK